MTSKFNFVVCSIEESKDIDVLSLDELQSFLIVHEQQLNQQETQEQALKASTPIRSDKKGGRGRRNRDCRNQHQPQPQDKNFHNDFRRRGRGRGGHHSTTFKPKSADKSNVECYRCHRYGHYQSECRTNLLRRNGEKSNFAEKEEEEEEVSLLMVCHAKEDTNKNLWYLDTGCSNHMSGDKSLFSYLDESFRDNVKFGDHSKVSVMGRGKVEIRTKENSVQTISNVLYVPDLKTNLLSAGQLQEKGYEIFIKGGVCSIQDENWA